MFIKQTLYNGALCIQKHIFIKCLMSGLSEGLLHLQGLIHAFANDQQVYALLQQGLLISRLYSRVVLREEQTKVRKPSRND